MKGKAFTEALFNAAINGQMTQFCEKIKQQPHTCGACYEYKKSDYEYIGGNRFCMTQTKPVDSNDVSCNRYEDYIFPRFKVGEKVYLKEPYYYDQLKNLTYKYDNNPIVWNYDWENKLSMPEKYARHFIEITGVRCERLQYISDDDCLNEGVYLDCIEDDYFHYHDNEQRYYCDDCEITGRERLIKEALENRGDFGFDNDWIDDDWIKEEIDCYSVGDDSDIIAKTCDICGKDLSVFKNPSGNEKYYTPQEAYAALIDKINGKGSWKRNPYVFKYIFRLIGNNNNQI